jgi:SAM-dependent methyltransferase
VAQEEHDHIIEGVLHCPNRDCQREYPIVDGIPIIVTNIRQYVADNIAAITGRRDQGELVEGMLGDCCGPDSVFNQTRQYLSSYAWDHYGDLDPAEPATEPRPGSMLRTLQAGVDLAGAAPAGPWLDAGCSVGRSSFALAERSRELVLGVDLNFAKLRLAAAVLREGRVQYPRRRVGLVYDRRDFAVDLAGRDLVDFWACDATALPFGAGAFALAASMNVLDCVSAPREFLASLGRMLQPGGQVVLACPYDWSLVATPLENWLGGHSQRSPAAGASEMALRALLTPGAGAGSIETLELKSERDDLLWQVRLHDRSTMTYRLHLVVAEKAPARM